MWLWERLCVCVCVCVCVRERERENVVCSSLSLFLQGVCVVHSSVTLLSTVTGAECSLGASGGVCVCVCVCVFNVCVWGWGRYTRVPPVLSHVAQHWHCESLNRRHMRNTHTHTDGHSTGPGPAVHFGWHMRGFISPTEWHIDNIMTTGLRANVMHARWSERVE